MRRGALRLGSLMDADGGVGYGMEGRDVGVQCTVYILIQSGLRDQYDAYSRDIERGAYDLLRLLLCHRWQGNSWPYHSQRV